jgi:hypothetical protein
MTKDVCLGTWDYKYAYNFPWGGGGEVPILFWNTQIRSHLQITVLATPACFMFPIHLLDANRIGLVAIKRSTLQ